MNIAPTDFFSSVRADGAIYDGNVQTTPAVQLTHDNVLVSSIASFEHTRVYGPLVCTVNFQANCVVGFVYQTVFAIEKMGFKKRKNARKGKQPTQRPDRRNEPYPELIRHNDAFNRYYKHANICTEPEFEDFLAVLRDPLPTTFRITGYKAEAQRLLDLIKNELFNTYATEDDAAVKKPFCLPWYPNEMGWQLELSRKDIRRSEKYYKLHNFLIAETDAGSISRQEAVSMIPPLVLDVQSHHKVLGECLQMQS